MKSDVHFIIAESTDDFEAYYRLRYELLRKPWGQPESSVKDAEEDRSIHVLVRNASGEAVGTGRLQINSQEEGQVRSMTVREKDQRSGLGSRILMHLEKIARERGMKRLILDARDTATGFYEASGYTVTGESYTLFNTIRHLRMEKML